MLVEIINYLEFYKRIFELKYQIRFKVFVSARIKLVKMKWRGELDNLRSLIDQTISLEGRKDAIGKFRGNLRNEKSKQNCKIL